MERRANWAQIFHVTKTLNPFAMDHAKMRLVRHIFNGAFAMQILYPELIVFVHMNADCPGIGGGGIKA